MTVAGRYLTGDSHAASPPIVRRDHGAVVASATGRMIVMAPQRAGGQAQFIDHRPVAGDPGNLGPTLQWIEGRLETPMTVADIAARAAMSPRNLARRFRAHTGATPMQWLLGRRIQRVRELLETTDLTVDRIARTTGFGSAETLRHHFGRQVGCTPSLYRATFRVDSGTPGLAARLDADRIARGPPVDRGAYEFPGGWGLGGAHDDRDAVR